MTAENFPLETDEEKSARIEAETLDLWHMVDELGVVAAASLIAGYDPAYAIRTFEYDNEWELRYPKLVPALTAIQGAVRARKVKATVRHRAHVIAGAILFRDPDAGTEADLPGLANDERAVNIPHRGTSTPSDDWLAFSAEPDWVTTTIELSELKRWLDEERNVRPAFFFKQQPGPTRPPYLDPSHSRYAPKLAAAVCAWTATDAIPGNKTPKQALDKWLREHAAEFGKTNEDGVANETFVEEASKVANWKPGGGAPKSGR